MEIAEYILSRLLQYCYHDYGVSDRRRRIKYIHQHAENNLLQSTSTISCVKFVFVTYILEINIEVCNITYSSIIVKKT